MVVSASHREGGRRRGSRILGLLERPQRLNGAREHRGVLFESRDAAALRGHHGAKVVDHNLELRSAARELAEGLLVQDDVLAHELQVVDRNP